MGLRGRPCKICISPELKSSVDAQMSAGESYVAIARATGINKFAVARHRKHAFPDIATEDKKLSPLERSERRLAELSSRAESQWLAAASTGDSRAALDILKSQIRLALDLHARLVEKAATSTDKKNAPTFDDYDAALRTYREQQKRKPETGIACPCCLSCGSRVRPEEIRSRWAAIEAASKLPAAISYYALDAEEQTRREAESAALVLCETCHGRGVHSPETPEMEVVQNANAVIAN
jgi:hypothetical protein